MSSRPTARALLACGLAAVVGLASACTGEDGSTRSRHRGTLGPRPDLPVACEDPLPRLGVVPSADGILTAAYTDSLVADSAREQRQRLDDFVDLTGKRPAIAMAWSTGAEMRFPTEDVSVIWEAGVVPAVVIFPFSTEGPTFGPDPVYTTQAFIDGAFDDRLTRWARDAKASGIPLMVSFTWESNAGWPWSGHHNGGGRTDAYGDPTWPDGPERWRDAYRHVVDLFRREGVTNVSWMFSGGRNIEEPWNDVRWYYPGDAYVDWVATGLGAYFPPYWNTWRSFHELMEETVAQFRAVTTTKPMFLELAIVEDPAAGDKAAWITEAYRELRNGLWPEVAAVEYWDDHLNGSPPGSAAIDSSAVTLHAYREAVADRYFRDTATVACA